MAVVSFQRPPRTATVGASRYQITRFRVREWLGAILNKLSVPGAIRSAVIRDELTGSIVEVSTGPLFTKLSVNGRDYYFERCTGRYDGSGSGCS
jgi:hypothetical protein